MTCITAFSPGCFNRKVLTSSKSRTVGGRPSCSSFSKFVSSSRICKVGTTDSMLPKRNSLPLTAQKSTSDICIACDFGYGKPTSSGNPINSHSSKPRQGFIPSMGPFCGFSKLTWREAASPSNP